MGLLSSTADVTQRCNTGSTFLVTRRGGGGDRESGARGFGYSSVSVIVASAAAATATALVLVLPSGKKWYVAMSDLLMLVCYRILDVRS